MKIQSMVFVVLMLVGCGDNGNDRCDPHIGLIGDSLTWLPGWVELLSEEYELKRHAFPGFTTESWLPGSDAHEAEEFSGCSYVILLGTNDAGFRLARPWTEFIDNMRLIADDLVREHEADEIILMIPPPRMGDGIVVIFSNNLLEDYRSALFELCEESFEDAIVCGPDLFRNARPEYFLDDGVHFSSLGAEWVYQELSWFLENDTRM